MRQTTLAAPVTVSGAGLHTGVAGRVTLHPAPADSGLSVAETEDNESRPMTWENWVWSRMSTSIDRGGGRRIRTIEHLMAALFAYGVNNVRVECQGPEIPIFDGSARQWCRCLRTVGLTPLAAPRRALRIAKPVQIARDGGFLRAEPASHFEVDVTHDILPAFPIMRWNGPVDAASFDRELAAARSFGSLRRRLGLSPKTVTRPAGRSPIVANMPDPNVPISEEPWARIDAGQAQAVGPLLRGWRPWRATLIAGGRVWPWPRFDDEPVRHVALDMIGDLALAGLPLVGRVVAHNPSHEKTFALVAALMAAPDRWDLVTLDEA